MTDHTKFPATPDEDAAKAESGDPTSLAFPSLCLNHNSDSDNDDGAARSATLKIDLVVIPLVSINIGNARLAGLQKDLKMTNTDFSTVLTITYVPYILAELPMNLVMKRLGPNVTLPLMVILWGMVCACQGAVTTYQGLLVCRFFLGALEGGILPGIVLYLSSFYRRHSMQLRFSMMFSATSLAGAFSGLLAAAIQNLDGVRGLGGWAWIFILEGVFTVVFGIATAALMPASPATFKLLSDTERSAYLRQLTGDWSGDSDEDGQGTETFSWSEVKSVFADAPHVLIMCLPLFLGGVTLFGLANFTPTIVNALGFSPTRSQLLTVPPYACSFVISIACSYFCDKYKQRSVMAIASSLVASAGFAIFIGTANKNANYAALFLQIIGTYSAAPCLSTWNANNVQPHYRRATAIAMAFISTNLGGIVSTWIFIDPPRFHVASAINLSFSLGIVAFSAGIWIFLAQQNKRKREVVRRMVEERGLGQGDGEWDSKEERRRWGDRHPRFEYTT
ncbi:MFS general substrate transporter [Amylostereum chailletii]|nr:MFS general substrate transporter [Amylostereum chailletii]